MIPSARYFVACEDSLVASCGRSSVSVPHGLRIQALAHSAGRFLFVLSAQCFPGPRPFRSLFIASRFPQRCSVHRPLSFFVARLKLELFFPHCPVLFDSHRPGCRPQLLLLVVESLPNLKFPVHGSKSQLVKGSRDQAWSVLICLQSRWCLGHV
jgi:hypothetical protein